MAAAQLPFIPEFITVHLGRPDQEAPNVQVTFPDYIKNVASSEIFPTWPESAIRANIYAQISFALNRIYTEWYRSRGYDFDITNSTQYDQAYVHGRDIFENIDRIVDEIFNDYVQRQGYVEPYFTQFCDGRQVQCDGLSQWGSVDLANQGYTPYEILQYYYGDDINIVQNAPVRPNIPTYQGYPLELGDVGNQVRTIQIQLNRIARNYPAIPTITPTNGVFGVSTEQSVRTFQRVFNLNETGVVDKATWYKIKYIYTGVKRLGELASEGLMLEEVTQPFPQVLQEGDTGSYVSTLQYYLALIGYFNPVLPVIAIDGIFGPKTTEAVRQLQTIYGLTVDGIVGPETWNQILDAYSGIVRTLSPSYQGEKAKIYPGYVLSIGMQNDDVADLQTYLSQIATVYAEIPAIPVTGYFGEQTQQAVQRFQELFGIEPTGLVGAVTWNALAREYDSMR